MKKEEVYLYLTKLTKEQLINVAESVKDEMFSYSYKGLIKGSRGRYEYLHKVGDLWTRSSDKGSRKEITYDEFLINFGKQQPQSIAIPKVDHSYKDVDVSMFEVKPTKEIKLSDYLPNPVMITLPIEDYNRLRKLELKAEIKKLRKEYKQL